MKTLKAQLKELSKSLAALSRQADRLTKQVDRLQAAAAKKKIEKKKVSMRSVKKGAARKKPTMIDSVYTIIKRNKNGIAIPKLQQKTGLELKQLNNVLFKLTQKRAIKAKKRGIYQAR